MKNLKNKLFLGALVFALFAQALQGMDRQNLALEKKIEGPEIKRNAIITPIKLWLYDTTVTTPENIYNNFVVQYYTLPFTIDTHDTHSYKFSHCKQLCLNRHDTSLGIGMAKISFFKGVPEEYGLRKSIFQPYGMRYKPYKEILQEEDDFVLLKHFEIFAKHGGKGYGPYFFNEIATLCKDTYPAVKTIVFQAVPLLRPNELSQEKLCEFYSKLGAVQSKKYPQYFYYNLNT